MNGTCAHIGCTGRAGRKGLCKSHLSFLMQREWRGAEHIVRFWLKTHGVDSELSSYNCPFDLITSNGIRLEVKWSPLNHDRDGSLFWQFNIHRHGVMSEGHVDFYIFRCEGEKAYGLGKYFHLVVPSPVNAKVLRVSPRSLITTWSKYFNAARLITAIKGRPI